MVTDTIQQASLSGWLTHHGDRYHPAGLLIGAGGWSHVSAVTDWVSRVEVVPEGRGDDKKNKVPLTFMATSHDYSIINTGTPTKI